MSKPEKPATAIDQALREWLGSPLVRAATDPTATEGLLEDVSSGLDQLTAEALQLFSAVKEAAPNPSVIAEIQDLLDVTLAVLRDNGSAASTEQHIGELTARIQSPPSEYICVGPIADRALEFTAYLGGPDELALVSAGDPGGMYAVVPESCEETFMRYAVPGRGVPGAPEPGSRSRGLWLWSRVTAVSQRAAVTSFIRNVRIVAGYLLARGLAERLPFALESEASRFSVFSKATGSWTNTLVASEIGWLPAGMVTRLLPESRLEQQRWSEDQREESPQQLRTWDGLSRRLVGLVFLLERQRHDAWRPLVNALELFAYAAASEHPGASVAVAFSALEGLFTAGKQKEDVTSRLAARVAGFLTAKRGEGTKLEARVRDLYAVRSCFVHEANVSTKVMARAHATDPSAVSNEVGDLLRQVLRKELRFLESEDGWIERQRSWDGVVEWSAGMGHPRAR